jgi:hypothetical protein
MQQRPLLHKLEQQPRHMPMTIQAKLSLRSDQLSARQLVCFLKMQPLLVPTIFRAYRAVILVD